MLDGFGQEGLARATPGRDEQRFVGGAVIICDLTSATRLGHVKRVGGERARSFCVVPIKAADIVGSRVVHRPAQRLCKWPLARAVRAPAHERLISTLVWCEGDERNGGQQDGGHGLTAVAGWAGGGATVRPKDGSERERP